MSDYVLAIDCGTQSTRALLVDARGAPAGSSRVLHDRPAAPRPGWAEQDPRHFWDALCRACRELWAATSVSPDRVRGVALTSQRGTVVSVDARGEPLRPAILWLDNRRTEGLPPIGGRWGLAFRLLGLSDTIADFQADAEINWLRTHEPERWRSTERLLLLSGYLTHRLTGRFVDSAACQVGYLPFDYKAGRWAAPSSWHWLVVPIEPARLPELVPPTERLGAITPEAAAATGIPAGTPLVAAAGDDACEALGLGATDPSIGCVSYGTGAAFSLFSRRYVEPFKFVPPYPAAVPGAYTVEYGLRRGYWLVSWFRDQLGAGEDEAALDRLAEAVPAGCDGLVLQPFWAKGVRYPGPEARGSLVGLADAHTRGHLYRALLEGIAFALREGKEIVAARTGVPVAELRVAGGGARSDVAMQITADVFGLPAARARLPEAAALGAAIAAAVGTGLHPDAGSAVAAMAHPGERFEPDPDRQRLYDGLYRGVYKPLYPAVSPIYRRLRAMMRPDA